MTSTAVLLQRLVQTWDSCTAPAAANSVINAVTPATLSNNNKQASTTVTVPRSVAPGLYKLCVGFGAMGAFIDGLRGADEPHLSTTWLTPLHTRALEHCH